MFTKVLIANRGEIAVRIMRTCKRLGIATVAVHSTADAGALHVRLADESVDLGGGPASENYLSVAAIVKAALDSGAEAVHPGYGFLAENTELTAAIAAAGLTFVGPSAAAIETMGEKVAARAVAVAAGVPLAPGSPGPVSSADEVLAFAEDHGYPVIIKASFGGGGRGMRKVANAGEVAEAFDAATREATAAFGNGAVYCERYLENARHVEVQIFADSHGNGVYLGDRDCSVQRRHQKLIEEAPAPGLSDDVRRAMGESAVRLAAEVAYAGAGTVEYLYEDGEFYFLEMNTRIQVEHPVTEETTGIDIVEEQLRVAFGEPLSWTQDQIVADGVSVEARINAEDPAGGLFLPTPGMLEALDAPSGEGLRWDAGYAAGDEVLPLYDSLIGKLIAVAPTREEAIEKLRTALHDLHIVGVHTTAPAAEFILGTEDFRAGTFSTLWLERSVEFPDFEEWGRARSRSEVEVVGRYYSVPRFNEGATGATGRSGVPDAATVAPSRKSSGPRRARGGKRVDDGTITSPMQGTIVKANVASGDIVTAGALMFVLEAMKMENPIIAPKDGTIGVVNVQIGDSTPAGHVLAAYAGANQ